MAGASQAFIRPAAKANVLRTVIGLLWVAGTWQTRSRISARVQEQENGDNIASHCNTCEVLSMRMRIDRNAIDEAIQQGA